jgi:L-alanine-DL-glutamate epimerase-like enolase superfamily enzyme
MTIANIRVHCLTIPARPLTPLPAAGGTATRHTLVEVETDDGRVGLGEAFRLAPGAMKALILDELRPLLVGQDESAIAALTATMRRSTFRYGRKGLAVIAISAVEVALWDLLGKRAGLPLVDLLGGSCRNSLPAYASLPRYATPLAAAQAAAGYVAAGYGGVKLHQSDPGYAAEVRAAIGPDIALMFDASGAWTPRDALDAAREMARCDVLWLEEPVARMDDYAGLAWVAARSPIRIAGGENEYTVEGFAAPIAAHAFDLVQPDIIKCGGIAETRKILALAEAHNIEMALHAFCHGPGLLATAQLSLAVPDIAWLEVNPVALEHEFLDRPIRIVRGQALLPDGAGLGVTLDADAVKRFGA